MFFREIKADVLLIFATRKTESLVIVSLYDSIQLVLLDPNARPNEKRMASAYKRIVHLKPFYLFWSFKWPKCKYQSQFLTTRKHLI